MQLYFTYIDLHRLLFIHYRNMVIVMFKTSILTLVELSLFLPSLVVFLNSNQQKNTS